jgi:hypothetical protein
MNKFTTKAAAMRSTKLSYLGGINTSSKILKGAKYNNMTYILYLAPHKSSGYNVCAGATAECINACLNESGHNKIDSRGIINNARLKKTTLFFEDRNFFCGWLFAEITTAQKKAAKLGYDFSVRINGTSDINLKLFNYDGINILEKFNDVQFYDYTKIANRFEQFKDVANYDLTYSFSGHNWDVCQDIMTNQLGRVAMVFEGKLPNTFDGFEVIDADAYDMRYKDAKGVICGLKFKKVRNKIDQKNNAFIIALNDARRNK